jgi:hypothetical protein
MGKSLRVLDSGSWSTVESPYIMDGGSWKTVHKVWVMNGGAWKESHITAYTKYNSGSGGQSTTSTSGTWTVPPNTRYIRVTILGNGGGGGTSNRTNVYFPRNGQESGDPGAYWTGSGWATNYSSVVTSADGGDGGAGGKAEVVMEVEPGTVFTYTNLGSPGGGGNQDDSLPNSSQTQAGSGTGNLYLRRNNYDSDYNVTPPTASTNASAGGSAPDDGHTDVGTYQTAAHGTSGDIIQFTGASAVGGSYNITVYGGNRGLGGYLKAQTRTTWQEWDWVFRYWTYLYTITATPGSNGSDGSQTSSGGNRVVTTMTTGGGSAGGGGGNASAYSAPGGSTGTGGSITIATYQGI